MSASGTDYTKEDGHVLYATAKSISPLSIKIDTAVYTAFMNSVDQEVSSMQLCRPTIDINDSKHEIVLLDISNNKKWIAYITYKINYMNNSTGIEEKKRIFITRKRFTATDKNTGAEELAFSGNPVSTSNIDHFSFEITDYVKDGGQHYCKFLSISQDGKYVVLSFFERNTDDYTHHISPNNPNCLIFEMKKDFKEPRRIKCKGRAVFLNQNHSLAIISPNTVKIYADFPKSESMTSIFDLLYFRSTETHVRETLEDHMSFIQNASWLDISKNETEKEIRRVITLSRHIDHNLLITPFSGGIVRIWSLMEDGARLTSFYAPKQHVMAFSKNYKYTAAYIDNTRSVHIYNIKSGILVYRLNSREKSDVSNFTISHIRFCYDSRYVAMAGWEGNNVVFEVWNMEAEKSIYRTTEVIVTKTAYKENERREKVVQPFISRELKDGKKCLKGYYASYYNGRNTTVCIELDIDRVSEERCINWINDTVPYSRNTYEIENSLQNFENLRCGNICIGGKDYLVRFGKHTVQLWNSYSDDKDDGLIKDEDKLLYIRAYKGPDYGIDCSFRETWKIDKFESIKFIGGDPSGRLLVNITECNEENKDEVISDIYHTEEIFLPLDELLPPDNLSLATQNNCLLAFDCHKLESACQALHFLFNSDKGFTNIEDTDNFNVMFIKFYTRNCHSDPLFLSSLSTLDINSKYFLTIAGSRTLAMLASFEKGRRIIFMIIKQSVPISIFSYVRPQSNINRDKINRESSMTRNQSENSLLEVLEETNTPTLSEGVSYRSSPLKPVNKTKNKNQLIASNENVLTVLVQELSYGLYKLLFNRILSDSQNLGSGGLSSLTDALLFLQEKGNSDLLLSSSQTLSYLGIGTDRLAILSSETLQIMKVKKSFLSFKGLESRATMEQIKKHDGIFSVQMYLIQRRYISWTKQCNQWKAFINFYKFNIRNIWRKLFIESKEETQQLLKVCVVPLPHFISYTSFSEDLAKNTRYDDVKVMSYKKNSAFVSSALDQHENSIFLQSNTVLEVLLEYKWKMFARKKFILIFFIHVLYYVSYLTGVLFSRELYIKKGDDGFDMSHPGHITSLVVMGISLAVLSVQKIRYVFNCYNKTAYIASGYNWMDIAAFGFPVFTVLQSLLEWNYFIEVCNITILVLGLHCILRFRTIFYFGFVMEVIAASFKNVSLVIFATLLVIIGCIQTFMEILVEWKGEEYFQYRFSGRFKDTSTIDNYTIGEIIESATVSLNNKFKEFLQGWFFLLGVWDPVNKDEAEDSGMFTVVRLLFLFLTVLILFNTFNSIKSDIIKVSKERAKKAWVNHFAAAISEIEFLWCSKKEKCCRINNPTHVYYIVPIEEIVIQENKLEMETRCILESLPY